MINALKSFGIKNKSKSKKTLFNVGHCKQYSISFHLKWVLVADKTQRRWWPCPRMRLIQIKFITLMEINR